MISAIGFWHSRLYAMTKPTKKRKGDAAQVAHSVMQDIIGLSNKPVATPPIMFGCLRKL